MKEKKQKNSGRSSKMTSSSVGLLLVDLKPWLVHDVVTCEVPPLLKAIIIFSVLLLRNDLILHERRNQNSRESKFKSNQENYDECTNVIFRKLN